MLNTYNICTMLDEVTKLVQPPPCNFLMMERCQRRFHRPRGVAQVSAAEAAAEELSADSAELVDHGCVTKYLLNYAKGCGLTLMCMSASNSLVG